MQKLLKSLPKIPATRNWAKTLPQTAGIYVFWGRKTLRAVGPMGRGPIYIGKAVNLRNRVLSYFDLDLEAKTARMTSEATHISFIQVTSELEALLLEARLIRKYMPQYNIAAKDDKHPLYIVITKERYPRVLSARKLMANGYLLKASFGPFPSSQSVRLVLKMLRRIFPYSDHKIGKRGCLYSHIGLCNPCPSEIEKLKSYREKELQRNKYLNNIRHIKAVLDGNIGKVRSELVREMNIQSKLQDYEAAAKARDQIKKLEYITQPQMPVEVYMENPNLYEDIRAKELKELKTVLSKYNLRVTGLDRIECFDIAHLAGANPTASMVTFTAGEPDKKLYRHFKVNQKKGNSDTDSMREIIKRRLNHLKDWGTPNLIIVDGGKPQVGVFIRELENVNIPVVGLAKRFETLVIPTKIDDTVKLKEYKLPKGPALNLATRIRDEAHRFARKYHHTLISKSIYERHS